MSDNANISKHLHTNVVLIVALSVMISLGIAAALVSASGAAMTLNVVIAAVLCPMVVATPVSYIFLRQSYRFDAVCKQLEAAHHRLSETHRVLEDIARRDRMTGLVNRETFLRTIAPGRRRSDSGFLFIVDADHFRIINESHGHRTGDRALQAMAAAISRSIREGDMAARISGSEFAVFLPGASLAEAITASERICKTIEHLEFRSDAGEKIPLTVSIGGAECVGDKPLDGVLTKVDRLLEDAKTTGRNRAVVVPALARAA